jgi:hypothetical protein
MRPEPGELQDALPFADLWTAMGVLDQVVAALQGVATNSQTNSAVVAVVRSDGQLDLRIPPASALRSATSFFCILAAGLREAEASAVGVVLPIRTVWGEACVCSYLDAEALALVAVEDFGDVVGSVGMSCPLHELPDGWEEAHDRLQSIAKPLRLTLARRPLSEEEAV